MYVCVKNTADQLLGSRDVNFLTIDMIHCLISVSVLSAVVPSGISSLYPEPWLAFVSLEWA